MERSLLVLFVFATWFVEDARCQSYSHYFQTYVGCNATFVCYKSPGEAVNWTTQGGGKSEISHGPFYSILTIVGLTTADQGNFSCIRRQKEILRFTLEVQTVPACVDKFNTGTCQATVGGGDDCTHPWMREHCTKSCGLCPKVSCTEVQEATVPPTTAHVPATTTLPLLSTTMQANSPSTGTLDENTEPGNSSTIYSPRCCPHLIMALFLLWMTIS